MAKAPVLGNDPFLRGAAPRPEPEPEPAPQPPAVEEPVAAPKAKAAAPARKAAKAAKSRPAKSAPKAAAAKPKPEPKKDKKAKPSRKPPRSPIHVVSVDEEDLEAAEEQDAMIEQLERESRPLPDVEDLGDDDEESEERTPEHRPDLPPTWLDRARQAASGLAGQAVHAVLENAFAARTLESVMASPVTHRFADTAAKAVSAARPALDIALRLLPPAAQATRTAVASVVSGEAARTFVSAATEAGAAVHTAARRSEPEASEVDDFGEDPTLLSRSEPLFDFLYDRYFRLEAQQACRVPAGASILVCNHSGVLPLDGPMVRTVLRRECKRGDCRWLVEDALFHAPVLGALLNRLGGVRACPENAERLLARKLPLAVFPEGLLGISKPVSRRYQLQRFGRGGFVKLALRTRAPIVPVAVVGAEEASPLLAKIPLGLSVGLPYLPVTPTFPLLGPLGLIPFPTKWTVSFLEPVSLKRHGPEEAENPALVAKITAEVRDAIQAELDRLVAHRQSLLSG